MKKSEQIEVLYKAFPRHVGKGAALKSIERALKKADFETLMDAVTEFAASPKGRGDYCPYPATWFNQERWDDDRSEWQRSGTNRPGREIGPGEIFDADSPAEITL